MIAPGTARRRAPVAVVGCGAVSTHGIGWRGLAGAAPPAAGTTAAVPPIAADRDAGNPKVRKTMSQAARLAAIALREALAAAAWTESRDAIGYYLGVGASGGPLAEVIAMFDASVIDGGLSMARLGDAGLRACNPMFTFQVLNNFAMCHGAILEGTGGPNGAWFSRGSGTVAALAEAVHALGDGDCDRCLAGGADTALHPVTLAELERDGFAAEGLTPGEGAAVLALAAAPETTPLARVEGVQVWPGRAMPLAAAVAAAAALWPAPDRVVISAWGGPPLATLRRACDTALPGVAVVDAGARLGETLAAAPALAWATGLDLIAGGAARVLCLSAGTDRDLGAVLLGAPR